MAVEKPSSGFGASALSSKFMYDYFKAYDLEPIDLELRIIKAFDQAFLEEHRKKKDNG